MLEVRPDAVIEVPDHFFKNPAARTDRFIHDPHHQANDICHTTAGRKFTQMYSDGHQRRIKYYTALTDDAAWVGRAIASDAEINWLNPRPMTVAVEALPAAALR